ncbi:MAG: acetate kinase [Epsilonproteobacteria bacterium]|nr:acetate kinase [Campylobacterota bacterium]
MYILVLNSGSSSLKYKLFEMPAKSVHYSGTLEEIDNHHDGVEVLLADLQQSKVIDSLDEIGVIGHRVVHGGWIFDSATVIDDHVIEEIEKLKKLAPLHNGANLEGIYAMKRKVPHIPQVAVFDTAFHQTIPKYSAYYPLSLTLSKEHHIQRYGFHGTSHHYVAIQAAKYTEKPLYKLNLITLHLGNGASACAIKEGKSIDTSMGFTPLEGLMMGSRSGDIDPSIIFYLERNGIDFEAVETILNHKSGLKAIAGTNDMRKVEALAKSGDKNAKLAIEMFVVRVKKYIGAYMVLLGRVDGIVFTGGIGEHSASIRALILEGFHHFEIVMDSVKNSIHSQIISSPSSKISLMVIPTDEELMIAKESYKLLQKH